MPALEGYKVLDLTWQGPGPFSTMILGDQGAEIIEITAPSAPGSRQTAKKSDVIYDASRRNKKSIQLNLKSETGRKIFYELAARADVVLEGFRPGVAKRLGIDYATLSKLNPRIVYCSISGFGQDGPYRDLPGHDIDYIAFAGVLELIGEQDGPPVVPLNLVGDFGASSKDAVIGILMALLARDKTGRGQHIDIALVDSSISLLTRTAVNRYFKTGHSPHRGELVHNGAYPYYNVYRTKDGKYLTIGCLEPGLWQRLCHEVGRDDFAAFHRSLEYNDNPNVKNKFAEITAYLKQTFMTKTRDEWFNLLSPKDIAIGKVYTLEEVFTDPQVLHRKMVIEVEIRPGAIKQVGIAIKLSETPGKVRNLAPVPGADSEAVLSELGYSKIQISQLRRDGII